MANLPSIFTRRYWCFSSYPGTTDPRQRRGAGRERPPLFDRWRGQSMGGCDTSRHARCHTPPAFGGVAPVVFILAGRLPGPHAGRTMTTRTTTRTRRTNRPTAGRFPAGNRADVSPSARGEPEPFSAAQVERPPVPFQRAGRETVPARSRTSRNGPENGGARYGTESVRTPHTLGRLTVPEHPRLLTRFFQSLRCALVGQAGLARRRRVQLLSGQDFSHGQDLDARMLAPREDARKARENVAASMTREQIAEAQARARE